MVATAIIAFAAGLLFSGAKFNSFREAVVNSYGYSATKKDDDLFETYSSDDDSSDEDGDSADQYKLMLCVRNDLKMGKGKMCAQCGHATLGLYRKFANSRFTEKWVNSGQAKIAVKINGEEEMLRLYKEAKANGIPAL
ncbi:putative peptidyl-tRNA hydrolase [Gregarina niphandrodes]|uniref:peptidyl-tRNA hydrolase n=1 Tax=Gregarina niphandrodes TaxID=110365 RepID=A0A023AYQ2_GRENI|nr:putative peptidyl-tRNA hydrolase [Gregarina niphandrodes]EZG43797.1 putative peptidyl-tRNA hydrolase [Gregarina niphandrodes]|eukprot:XP_011133007.1 putative peptidyl-tRNA hydrolase [Gregarina niphandrodes]